MNPDVPEHGWESRGHVRSADTQLPAQGQQHEAASDTDGPTSRFPSRRGVQQGSSPKRSIFPSAEGMEKAREMAANILEEVPNSLTAAKEQAHSLP